MGQLLHAVLQLRCHSVGMLSENVLCDFLVSNLHCFESLNGRDLDGQERRKMLCFSLVVELSRESVHWLDWDWAFK